MSISSSILKIKMKMMKLRIQSQQDSVVTSVQNSYLHARVSTHTGSQFICYISFLVISVDIKQHGRIILKLILSQNIRKRIILALTVVKSSHIKLISGDINSQPTMVKDILVVSVTIRQHGRIVSTNMSSQPTVVKDFLVVSVTIRQHGMIVSKRMLSQNIWKRNIPALNVINSLLHSAVL